MTEPKATWTPSDEILRQAYLHAISAMPQESVGVVWRGDYRRVQNKSTRLDSFLTDPREMAALYQTGAVTAIVHSHVNIRPFASEADMAGCEKTKLPWLILQVPSDPINYVVIEPSGWRAPLVGRAWAWGTHDCWGLVRDAYSAMAGLDLPDFERADWEFWKKDDDFIVRNYEAAGFVKLPQDAPLRHLDMMGMQVDGSPLVNHLGLFLEPDMMLHQLAGQLSVRKKYSTYYQEATVLKLRHKRLFGINAEALPHVPF